MSFRLRVLALVMLVAVTAIGATAWLTLRQASQQITESDRADQRVVQLVHDQLLSYGQRHGTWEGVPSTVIDLGQQTGERIHLASETGVVVSDTDQLDGRTARPLGSDVTLVDPRPTITLPTNGDPSGSVLKSITVYRLGVRFAACLTRSGYDVTMTSGALGVPGFAAAAGTDKTAEADCQERAREPGRDLAVDQQRIEACHAGVEFEPLSTCLARVFTDQISDVAAVPLRVTIGVVGEQQSPLQAGPMLAAAAGVAVLAIAGTALLSRRVLRPIARLTEAAGRLGKGDLSSRVAVVGSDEVAELGRSFNRMADSLQRGEERQRRLVADVAHELRTPLANLRGYLEALKDGVIAPDVDLFASLHEEAVLQQRIVNDLQDLALAEAGTLNYHRTVIDLAELMETSRAAHHAVAESAGVRLVVAAVSPVLVHADPDRLRQVLGNLVTNALRATPAGGSVTLAAAPVGPSVVVRVADTGTGIAARSLPYVFDRFWRADSARGRRTGGSGLGLAIARQIVTDHGGTITVASELGVGTTFTITLPPLAAPPFTPAAASQPRHSVPAESPRSA
ncbi:sensor histidine kinase [Phytohabitans rumicis]|uniref:histidine kinase n=1 Tax=Phytohabitans rumicis TaxID=1076125 RepID=A0A6V8L5Z7_9ACTN|nr:ATP-binding protein [Phytohabitans rumicis]GFJ90251.1 two-component sensor histidine kinase [Phytohabitans rumicis]